MKRTVCMVIMMVVAVMLLAACSAAAPAKSEQAPGSAAASSPPAASVEPAASSAAPAASSSAADTAAAAATYELKNVGVSIMEASWQYFVTVTEGMKDAGDKAGLNINFQDAKNDAPTQMSQVETFLNQDVDAIVADTIDAPSLAPSAAKAKEKGICFEARLVEVPDCTFTYLLDEHGYGVAIGTAGAQWANKNYTGKEVEVALVGMWDYKPSVIRFGGIQEAFLKDFPTGKIVTKQQANDASSGMAAMEAIKQANPNVKMVLCDCDDPGVGVAEALKSLVPKDKWGEYYVGGADCTPQAVTLIKEGSPMKSTVDLHNFNVGITSVQLLQDWAAGKPVDKQIWMKFDALTYEDVIKNY